MTQARDMENELTNAMANIDERPSIKNGDRANRERK